MKISRRDFLRMSALTAAGAGLAACCPTPTPGPAPTGETIIVTEPGKETIVEVTVPPVVPTDVPPEPIEGATVMVMMPIHEGEWPESYNDIIGDKYGIIIDLIAEDNNRRDAMIAAGNPPDIWRSNSIGIGNLILSGTIQALDDYIDVSEIITWDDLSPVHVKFKFTGPEVGEGPMYGVLKDWSPDACVFVWDDPYTEAGIDPLSEDDPITYQDYMEQYGDTLTKREGDRTTMWSWYGHYVSGTGYPTELFLNEWVEAAGGDPLYPEGMYEINLAGNEVAVEMFQFWFDQAIAGRIPSAIDPSPAGLGQILTQKFVPTIEVGFWYGPRLKDNEDLGPNVRMVPSMQWEGSSMRRNSCAFGTCMVMSSKTKNNAATWKALEWYTGEEPAIERGTMGWGIPALSSMVDLLPTEHPFDAQKYKVLQGEIPYSGNAMRYNPFFSGLAEAGAEIEAALNGDKTLEEALAAIESATNTAIQDGIDRFM